jgi:hypothetical protein
MAVAVAAHWLRTPKDARVCGHMISTSAISEARTIRDSRFRFHASSLTVISFGRTSYIRIDVPREDVDPQRSNARISSERTGSNGRPVARSEMAPQIRTFQNRVVFDKVFDGSAYSCPRLSRDVPERA